MTIFNLAILFVVTVALNSPAVSPVHAANPKQPSKNWEYAVAFSNGINLYDEQWQEMGQVATEFSHITSIVYDEIGDRIYFTDVHKHENTSIYALGRNPVNPNSYIAMDTVVERAHEDETIHGLAFDPVERSLFWIDEALRVIYTLDMKQVKPLPVIWKKFEESGVIPRALAVDVCRRYMYWSTTSEHGATIERATLKRADKEGVLIRSGIHRPVAMEIDQFSNQMFWIDYMAGTEVTIKSADLHGENTNLIYDGVGMKFRDLLVSEDQLTLVDSTNVCLRRMNKTGEEEPKCFQAFKQQPMGIIKRSRFADTHGDHVICEAAVAEVKAHQAAQTPQGHTDLVVLGQEHSDVICLSGRVSAQGHCQCSDGWTGQYCETKLCQNYCFHGKCAVSSTGIPLCHCDSGFTGERCEIARCNGYCLNDGRCDFENEEPVCHCPPTHSGRHCEMINSKPVVCRAYCEFGISVPNSGWVIEDMCSCGNVTASEPVCIVSTKGALGQSFIYVITGAVLLTIVLIVLMILGAIRRWYKPARPKIKKTYVVRKSPNTPMTYRPTPSERCEITIENCCNMEYCDTPCFDPKILVKDLDDKNAGKSVSAQKEDKRDLLNNIVLDNGDLF